MGVSVKTLSRILDLYERGFVQPGASILELGAQQLYCQGAEDYLREFIARVARRNPAVKGAGEYGRDELAAMADGGFMSKLMTACGFSYSAIDIFEAQNTIIFDLNKHEPGPDMLNRYDLVTNFGTTEHVVNQYLSMKTIHEITKPGGIIYHELPLGGFHTHGYFSYNPLFFNELASANRYDVVMQAYSKDDKVHAAPDYMVGNGFPDPGYYDFGIEFIFRKAVDAPFCVPLETSTSLGVSDTFLAGTSSYGAAAARSGNIRYGGAGLGKVDLSKYSGWELQRELIRRYRRRLARLFGCD